MWINPLNNALNRYLTAADDIKKWIIINLFKFSIDTKKNKSFQFVFSCIKGLLAPPI